MNDSLIKEFEIISQKSVFETPWFGIQRIQYTIEKSQIKEWESVYRPTTKNKGSKIDSGEVIPVIRYSKSCPKVVMIANFRSAVGTFSLQFPAGLLEGSDVQKEALRQLQEETGYKAERILKVPNINIHSDPWKSCQTGFLYIGIINGDDPNNQIEQKLDKEENIRVLTFQINDHLCESVKQYAEKQGYAIHAKLWSFCTGLNLTKFYDF